MVKEPVIKINRAVTGYRHGSRVIKLAPLNAIEFCGGEVTAVVGSNGIGKSTLLRSICGLLPVLEGDILLEGVEIKKYENAELARKVAIVLTEKVGGFNLRVRDVVAAGQMPYTNTFHSLKEQNRRAIDLAMDRAGVEHIADRLVSELSDGMFQKTMIARALAQQTQVLLLDEPTAFLDFASKHKLFILLRQLALEENKCLLISTHDLELALRYCHKVLVMDESGAELMEVNHAREHGAFQKIAGGFL